IAHHQWLTAKIESQNYRTKFSYASSAAYSPKKKQLGASQSLSDGEPSGARTQSWSTTAGKICRISATHPSTGFLETDF
ncbi:hypothetical protein LINPERPRIM_LOCUS33283, partial [Linum perenne]